MNSVDCATGCGVVVGEGYRIGVVDQREESLGMITESSLEPQELMTWVGMSGTPFHLGLLLASEIFCTFLRVSKGFAFGVWSDRVQICGIHWYRKRSNKYHTMVS